MNNGNLKHFKKGDDPRRANNGRKKKCPPLDELIHEVMGASNGDGITAAQKILEALRKKAEKGDVKAADILLDRTFGKVRQDIDFTSAGKRIVQNITDVKIIKLVRTEDGSTNGHTDTRINQSGIPD